MVILLIELLFTKGRRGSEEDIKKLLKCQIKNTLNLKNKKKIKMMRIMIL